MRVRPLINYIMSEIETFLCFLTTGLIFTVLIIIECTSGFYIRVRMVIICFSILSGIDCSESFHISHLYDSGYLFLRIYHSLSRVIHICTYVSLAT